MIKGMNVSIITHLCPCRHGLAQMDKRELFDVAMTLEHSFVYPCKFATGRGYECQCCSSFMPLLLWIFTGGQTGIVHVVMMF